MTFTGPNAIPDQPESEKFDTSGPGPTWANTSAEQILTQLRQHRDALENVDPTGSAQVEAPVEKVNGRHLATQTQYPTRTAIRTGVATFLLFLTAAAAVSADPTVGAFLSAHFPNLLPRVLLVGAFCGGLATVIKRVGSIPAVARLFVRIGLGVVPKSALK